MSCRRALVETPENQTLECLYWHKRSSMDIVLDAHVSQEKEHVDLNITPKCHRIDHNFSINNQHQFLETNQQHAGKIPLQTCGYIRKFVIGIQWIILNCGCLDIRMLMFFRWLIFKIFSPNVSVGILAVFCITVLSVLICTEDYASNTVQHNAITTYLGEKNYENEKPQKASLFEIEFIQQDTRDQQMAQYKEAIETLKNEMKIIEERCKRTEIQLLKQVQNDVSNLEKRHFLEMQKELNKIQQNTRRLIWRELSIYEADKIGIPDFALEANGGRIVKTIDTEEFTDYLDLVIFKLPLSSSKYSPWNIIQPWNEPRECWAFAGTTGKLVLQLAAPIHVKGVTMEHISPKISLFGKTNSAPKDFSVYGLKDPESTTFTDMELLGDFHYDGKGQPRQMFLCKASSNSYHFILLWIKNNQGNTEYTCVYRFRVHSEQINDPYII